MQKRIIIKGALTILIASIITRLLGFIFRIYIADKIGAEGMGIYQLITSLYMLVIMFSTSGITLAVSCITSEIIATQKHKCPSLVLKTAIFWALFISLIISLILFIFAKPIGSKILRDDRTIFSILCLAPSLPFMSVAACIKGYFYAIKKSFHPSNATVIEQIAKMVFIICIIDFYLQKGNTYSCAIISLGMTLGEIVSCVYIVIVHHFKNKPKNCKKDGNSKKIFFKILKISLPIQIGSTLNSSIRLAESVLIIEGLKIFTNGNYNIATSTYGIIKGMVLPLLLFPTSLLQSIITVLVPELSGANANGKNKTIQKACEKSLKLTLIMGIYISAIFLLFPEEISSIFYHDPNVGPIIKKLCILCPLMYLEIVCIGILSAIGEQVASVKYNIIDGILRLFLIWIFVPKGGVDAFLIIMIISNTFTALLNLHRLLKVTCLPLCFSKWLFKPFLSVLPPYLLCFIFKQHLKFFMPNWLCIIILSVIIIIWYLILLISFGCIEKSETLLLSKYLKRKNKPK